MVDSEAKRTSAATRIREIGARSAAERLGPSVTDKETHCGGGPRSTQGPSFAGTSRRASCPTRLRPRLRQEPQGRVTAVAHKTREPSQPRLRRYQRGWHVEPVELV